MESPAVYLQMVGAGLIRFRRFRPDPQVVDLVVAVVLTVTLQLEIWLAANGVDHAVAAALAGAVTTLAIGVRRRFPTTVGVTVGLLSVVIAAAWSPPNSLSYGIAWICDMYALAAWSSPRRFVLGLSAYLAAAVISIPFSAKPGSTVFFIVASTIVIVLVRRVLGDRERRVQLAERERDLVGREAIVEERARIARELHDAIAHNVSMMVVQAGAERRVLDDSSNESTRDVLQTVERIGRDALTEMRRMVGMLRNDGADPLAPQPGLDDLPTLVTQVREAGLPVELQIDGERRELPVGIELSAYRIVQEALTNALKHAGDAHASVHVSYGADSLEIEIIDDGPGAGSGAAGGHGLVGMRERVALYGGRIDAGRQPTGGFAVRVLLPIR
jgi:signal transduction histidine kinase